jgi:hypothetical protein
VASILVDSLTALERERKGESKAPLRGGRQRDGDRRRVDFGGQGAVGEVLGGLEFLEALISPEGGVAPRRREIVRVRGVLLALINFLGQLLTLGGGFGCTLLEEFTRHARAHNFDNRCRE